MVFLQTPKDLIKCHHDLKLIGSEGIVASDKLIRAVAISFISTFVLVAVAVNNGKRIAELTSFALENASRSPVLNAGVVAIATYQIFKLGQKSCSFLCQLFGCQIDILLSGQFSLECPFQQRLSQFLDVGNLLSIALN